MAVSMLDGLKTWKVNGCTFQELGVCHDRELRSLIGLGSSILCIKSWKNRVHFMEVLFCLRNSSVGTQWAQWNPTP